jgi:hypothetical protein
VIPAGCSATMSHSRAARAPGIRLGCTAGEPPGELLGVRHETGAGFRISCRLDRHDAPQPIATSTATGTPSVTMS